MQIWKLPSLVLLLKLTGHKRGVWAAAFSPLEQLVATASGDKTLRLWSIKDGACLRTLQGHSSSVLKLHYLSSGLQVHSSPAPLPANPLAAHLAQCYPPEADMFVDEPKLLLQYKEPWTLLWLNSIRMVPDFLSTGEASAMQMMKVLTELYISNIWLHPAWEDMKFSPLQRTESPHVSNAVHRLRTDMDVADHVLRR